MGSLEIYYVKKIRTVDMIVKLCTDKLNMNQQTKFQTYSSILQSMIFNEFMGINILNSIMVGI